MNTEEVRLFDVFWDHVREAEMDVAVNGHRGCPPSESGDPWDEDFATAYQDIKKFLGRFLKKGIYFPPPDMTWRPRPYAADTAHQALMEFLNPPQEVYGHPGVLDSPEYRAIKVAAVEELQHSKMYHKPPEVKHINNKISVTILEKVSYLEWIIISHHIPKDKYFVYRPISMHEIRVKLARNKYKCLSQPSITRLMKLVFKNGGMSEYKRLCRSIAILKVGFLVKYRNGTSSVDASVTDNHDDMD